VATKAARLNRKNLHQGGKRKTDRKRKTDLTLTVLLMDGMRRHVDYFREMRRNQAANSERSGLIFDFP